VLAGKRGQYDGEWVNGRRHGYGVASSFLADEGALAEIKGKDSAKDGAAQVEEPNCIYRGEWKNEMRHGYGIQEFYDGSRFEGQWEYNT
jgi:hypothetical protein